MSASCTRSRHTTGHSMTARNRTGRRCEKRAASQLSIISNARLGVAESFLRVRRIPPAFFPSWRLGPMRGGVELRVPGPSLEASQHTCPQQSGGRWLNIYLSYLGRAVRDRLGRVFGVNLRSAGFGATLPSERKFEILNCQLPPVILELSSQPRFGTDRCSGGPGWLGPSLVSLRC